MTEQKRRGNAYVPVLALLVFLLGMAGWFTFDLNVCRNRFARASTAADTLFIAEMHSCEFAASNDLAAIRGALMERCRVRGGYWLDKAIQVGETRTRCIVGPQPIPLTPLAESPRVP